jgi:Protein of unknown function (DUF1524)
VNLSSTTIEHVLPQTLTEEWKSILGNESEKLHAKWVDTFGNLTLTGYNPELGNIPFSEKQEKLANTHIELNRWILEQKVWRADEITKRADTLLEKAKALWPGSDLMKDYV